VLREKAADVLTCRAGRAPRQKIQGIFLTLNEEKCYVFVLDSHLSYQEPRVHLEEKVGLQTLRAHSLPRVVAVGTALAQRDTEMVPGATSSHSERGARQVFSHNQAVPRNEEGEC